MIDHRQLANLQDRFLSLLEPMLVRAIKQAFKEDREEYRAQMVKDMEREHERQRAIYERVSSGDTIQ